MISKRRKKESAAKVPPRFELGSLDSESRVLTITPWNRADNPAKLCVYIKVLSIDFVTRELT